MAPLGWVLRCKNFSSGRGDWVKKRGCDFSHSLCCQRRSKFRLTAVNRSQIGLSYDCEGRRYA